MTNWGQLAADRLNQIAQISEPGPGVTRLPFTPEHKAAITLLTEWMEDAGLDVHLDNAGTLIGRYAGIENAGTFYLGSHQDSVREGGAFDGIMGIVLPILALKKLKNSKTLPSFSIEILAFADEEGVRWPTALIGSRAVAGTFDPTVLKLTDRDGTTLREAIENFGLMPDQIEELKRPQQAALGYLETHIEQGPVLEEKNSALGVVTAICGIERHQIIITGETGHAGTLPMASRRDAVVTAAAIVTEVDRLANSTPDLRATVGEMHIQPNVVNAVPREVRMTIELRSPVDAIRIGAGEHMQAFAQSIAAERSMKLKARRTYSQPAQPCDEQLTESLAKAVSDFDGRAIRIPSGATHDASAMADLCPISMLFVRCKDGVSHSPQEHATAEDLGIAVNVLAEFLSGFAE